MKDVAPELRKWIVSNHCTYDIDAIVELQDGLRTEVGFELNLHAQFPWTGEVSAELRAKYEEIRVQLDELVDALVPDESDKARFEVVPFRAAVRFRGGADVPSVTRSVRVFHRNFEPVQANDREKFAPFEQELLRLGIKRT